VTLFFLDFRQGDLPDRVRSTPLVCDRAGRDLGPAALAGLRASFSDFTLVVHGFNVTRAEGLAACAELERAARIDATCWLGVLWPGSSPTLGALCYPWKEGPADETGTRLATALDSLAPRRLSVVAHSLGCRVVLQTLRALRSPRCDEVALLAGAVDCDALVRSDRYRDAVARAGRVVVVSSKKDHVLEWAFPVGDVVAELLHGGYSRCALGRCGSCASGAAASPNTIGVPIAPTNAVDHGDYLPGAAGNSKAAKVADLVRATLLGEPKLAY
jgi:hypothetical protein